MRVIVFEDKGYEDLYPLTYLRPSYSIKTGAYSLLDCLRRELGSDYDVSVHCRNYMAAYLNDAFSGYIINNIPSEDTLFINGRFLISRDVVARYVTPVNLNTVWTHDENVVMAYVSAGKLAPIKEKAEKTSGDNTLALSDFEPLGLNSVQVPLDDFVNDIIEYKYPWDVFDFFKYLLERDIMWKVRQSASLLHNAPGVTIIARDDLVNITYGRAVHVMPNVVIDCMEGGVVIDDEAVIEPFVFIKGPVYIGKNCVIKSGAKIYGPCSIGEHSKVTGEISSSIFHSYVNKQHDGFIGNSYICPMVNLGADTVTSNLKNNYSTIRMNVRGEEVDTESIFLGSIIGDHSKFGINTMLNTGSMIGIFANVFGGGFPPKEIGSFSWNDTSKKPERYDIEKALETAEKALTRRHLELTPAYEALIRKLYEETAV